MVAGENAHALHLAISGDGREWRAVAIVEKAEKGEFSYPAMIQTKDGKVHMTYTWNRQRIRHVVIDPGKLVGGHFDRREVARRKRPIPPPSSPTPPPSPRSPAGASSPSSFIPRMLQEAIAPVHEKLMKNFKACAVDGIDVRTATK